MMYGCLEEGIVSPLSIPRSYMKKHNIRSGLDKDKVRSLQTHISLGNRDSTIYHLAKWVVSFFREPCALGVCMNMMPFTGKRTDPKSYTLSTTQRASQSL